ncbi:MAG: PKD domain-containing protein [Solirubrobacteraceae bacterium]
MADTEHTHLPSSRSFSRLAASRRGMLGLVAAVGAMLLVGAPSASAMSSPRLYTNASPSTQAGLQVWDHTNLMGGTAPTGTISFELFAPGDTGCTQPIFAATVPVSGTGSDDSPRYWTTTAGTYNWIASYSGDDNNNAYTTVCNDQSQAEIVNKRWIAETLTATQAGGVLRATLVITGGLNPTGHATLVVTGPNDTYCAGTPVSTTGLTINGAGTYVSAGFRPTTPGRYTYRLRYDGDNTNYGVGPTNCLDQAASITYTAPPVAAYTASTNRPATGQIVSFDASASSDRDGSIVSYRWVWNDGTPDGSGPTPTHAFTTAGLRSVALYVTSNDGGAAAVGHGFTVGDALPTAAYVPSHWTPAVGADVAFDASRSTAPHGAIVSYRWVWNDGTPDGTGPSPTHAFATAGKVSVALYVTDDAGQTDAVGHGITVAPSAS